MLISQNHKDGLLDVIIICFYWLETNKLQKMKLIQAMRYLHYSNSEVKCSFTLGYFCCVICKENCESAKNTK